MSESEVSADGSSAPSLPRRATWFELFADLVFVAAVGQITHRVGAHPDGASVAAAAGLFVPLWWAWVLYAMRANRADRDSIAHRLITTAGLVGVVGVAVFADGVGHSPGADTGFVLSYLWARGGVAALYAWDSRREPPLRSVLRSFLLGSLASAVFWVGGLVALHGSARYAAWVVAMVLELALPLIVRRRVARVAHEAEHLRERFGLFTIIVLGEAILGFTNGLVQARTAVSAALTGAAAFALTAGLWWSYFSAGGTRPGAHDELARGGRHLHAYVFGHLPLQLGLALTGASMGIAVSGGGSHLNSTAAACIIGGVAAFLLSTALIRTAFAGLRDHVALIRFAAALVLPLFLLAAVHVPVAVLLTMVAAAVALSVLAEAPAHRRH